MPLEGHWERQRTPLRRLAPRELRLIVAVAALGVAALAVTLALSLGGAGTRAPGRGCIRVTAASSTGGAVLHACGPAAARLCRTASAQAPPLARALRSECRRAAIGAAAGPGSGRP